MLLVLVQLELATSQGIAEKQREFLWRVADSYDKAGYLDIAESHLKELLSLDLTKEQKLEALCFLADIQVCLHLLMANLGGLPSALE
jgi:lipopolysaccharide biosynthesis regulator YciM